MKFCNPVPRNDGNDGLMKGESGENMWEAYSILINIRKVGRVSKKNGELVESERDFDPTLGHWMPLPDG